MRLLALSDLHVDHAGQRTALEALPDHGDDWVILAGDLAERLESVAWTLDLFAARFARVIWVPGNHELWTSDEVRGVAKYEALVADARARGVHTPEDGWLRWPGEGPPRAIVPLFLLYDYSFGPRGMTPAEVVLWAAQDGIRCTDELLLRPDPYPSRAAWCRARVEAAEALLATIPEDHRTVLVNHWPLRRDLVRLPAVPRFVPWCGTRATSDWHRRFRAEVVVHGHLHLRATDVRDGVRFEEVSLGYPRHWRPERGVDSHLREILPGPATAPGDPGPIWRP